VGHTARMTEMTNEHKMFVGEPEKNRPLGRPKRRWEDNIKTGRDSVYEKCGLY
jgi:hypothetical protein